jgi:hypothetical protein
MKKRLRATREETLSSSFKSAYTNQNELQRPISKSGIRAGSETLCGGWEQRQAGPEGGNRKGFSDAISRAVERFPEIFEAEKQFNPAGATRAAEEAALLEHAEKTGTLLDAMDFFRRWRESGAHGGNEHQVIVGDEGQPVEKRTNMPYFHNNWFDYLQRIRLHNCLFPEAPISVKGVQNQPRQLGTPHGDMMPAGVYVVTEQPFVKWARESTQEETADFLSQFGFSKVPVAQGENDTGAWHNPETGVRLNDVRGDNIVIRKGDDGKLMPVVLDVPISVDVVPEVISIKKTT